MNVLQGGLASGLWVVARGKISRGIKTVRISKKTVASISVETQTTVDSTNSNGVAANAMARGIAGVATLGLSELAKTFTKDDPRFRQEGVIARLVFTDGTQVVFTANDREYEELLRSAGR